MESKFRINSQQFFLTYPQCEASPDEALAELHNIAQAKRFVIEAYIIAQEKHEDGNHHLHVWLKTGHKLNVGSHTFFDFKGFHGKYEGCRSNKAVIKYVMKEGNYISSLSDKEIESLTSARENKTKYLGEELIKNGLTANFIRE